MKKALLLSVMAAPLIIPSQAHSEESIQSICQQDARDAGYTSGTEYSEFVAQCMENYSAYDTGYDTPDEASDNYQDTEQAEESDPSIANYTDEEQAY